MTYEDRYHSFAQYLKDRQIEMDFVPAEIINDLPDEAIMESFRLRDASSEDGQEFYSKEQERGIIMEYSSNEAIYQAFQNIKHSNHIDTVGEDLLKEYPDRMREISSTGMNPGRLDSILKDLKDLGINLETKAIDGALKESCSIFALWILEGCEYYIREDKDRTFGVDFDKACPACLLKKTLRNYRTIFGWSLYAKTDEFENRELKNCHSKIIEDATDFILNAVYESITGDMPNKRKYEKVMNRLFDIYFEYLMNLPLISCWMYGKELAQQRYSENEEAHKLVSYTHDYFSDKYSCLEPENEVQFFKDVDNYLRTLQLDQLEALYEIGFPVKMSRKQFNKVNKLLERLIIAMKKSEEAVDK
jgi:hypothetical protein